ncbi:MAG: HEAT repeat domain-containing protein, partial [bacterium]|nr:HEAT repeat domain-containing protein [bacterium]
MTKFIHIPKRLGWIVCIALLAFSAYAANPAVDEILAKFPANTEDEFTALQSQLIKTGPGGLADLFGRLTPAKEGGDVQARYAISGLTKFVQLQNDEDNRLLVIQAFLGALNQHQNKEVKAFLLEQVKFIAKDEVIAPVSRYLADRILGEPAAQVLVFVKTPSAAAALIQALPTADLALKPVLIQALGTLRCKAALPAILPYAQCTDAAVRLSAYAALAQIGDPAATDALNRALLKSSGSEQVQARIAYLQFANRLVELNAGHLALPLFQTLQTTFTAPEDTQVQCAALAGLVAIKGEAALEDLLQAIDSPYADVRGQALKLAAQFTCPKATWSLVEKAQTTAPLAQAEILTFLGQRGDRNALPTVLLALQSADSQVRQAAIAAAVQLGGVAATPALFCLLKDADQESINTVKAALTQVEGTYLLNAITQALPQVSDAAKSALLEVLAARQGEAFFQDVLIYASHENAAVRQAAIRTLSAIATLDSLPALIALLEKCQGDEAAIAERALLASVASLESSQAKVDALVAAFAPVALEKKAHLLRLLAQIRGEAALGIAASYLDCPVLKKEAAQAVVAIACPKDNEGFGLHTRAADAALE